MILPRLRILLGFAALQLAASTSARAEESGRGPLVLLLSGGGARGAAHVGVLKVLEEQRVAVDAIVGTSMGALVGGLYAAGLSATEIEATMLDANWNELFSDEPDRRLESFRRKQDNRDFLVRGRLHLERTTPKLPLGALRGERIVDLLRAATAGVAGVDQFSRLPIPFRAVATDLETGAAVVLESGDLVLAIRASMAGPGAFTPVTIDGRHLIDGGIAENLAVEVAARAAGARILAVDISSPPVAYGALGSAAGVLNQAFTLLLARENERQLASLGPDDLLIRPALGNFPSAAFARAPDAIRIGEEAARAMGAELARYALPPDEYARWRAGRLPPPRGTGALSEVLVVGDESASGRATRRRLQRLEGAPLDREAVRREAEKARATRLYDSVDWTVVPDSAGGFRAEMTLEPTAGGPDSLLFGLRLADDFAGGTDFDLGARWIGRELTGGDLELRADLRLGERQRALLDAYRPFGRTHAFFLGAAGGFREEPFALYLDESLFFRLRRRDLFARFDFGAALGRWGEARLGIEQDWSRLRPSSDEGLDVASLRFDETIAHARLGLDTLDDESFPVAGALVTVELDSILASDVEEPGLLFGSVVARQAFQLGSLRLVLGVEAADTFAGDPAFPRAEAGGLFRLSGFSEGELRGSRLAIGELRVAQVIAGEASRNLVLLGGSVELGAVVPEGFALSRADAIWNGSLHLSVDSVLGPIFVYVGLAEGGRRSWGFSLGRQLF